MPIPFLATDDDLTDFPDVSSALSEPDGLLMAGANLNPARLLKAYCSGIFPWYEEGEPILWWSPNPRCVIWPKDIHITRSLAKTLRSGKYHISENTAFRQIMEQCGAPRAKSEGTWVTDDMIKAYCALHDYGFGRSLEVWRDDNLVGGLYGIQLGRVFVGESMFSKEPDASKVALVHLAQCGHYDLIDCQIENPHLVRMGSTNISRDSYIECLQRFGDLANATFSADKLRDNEQ